MDEYAKKHQTFDMITFDLELRGSLDANVHSGCTTLNKITNTPFDFTFKNILDVLLHCSLQMQYNAKQCNVSNAMQIQCPVQC